MHPCGSGGRGAFVGRVAKGSTRECGWVGAPRLASAEDSSWDGKAAEVGEGRRFGNFRVIEMGIDGIIP